MYSLFTLMHVVQPFSNRLIPFLKYQVINECQTEPNLKKVWKFNNSKFKSLTFLLIKHYCGLVQCPVLSFAISNSSCQIRSSRIILCALSIVPSVVAVPQVVFYSGITSWLFINGDASKLSLEQLYEAYMISKRQRAPMALLVLKEDFSVNRISHNSTNCQTFKFLSSLCKSEPFKQNFIFVLIPKEKNDYPAVIK